MLEELKKTLAGIVKSWTIWFNGMVVALIPMLQYATENYPAVRDFMPDDLYKQVVLFIVVVNLALRFKTTAALSAK